MKGARATPRLVFGSSVQPGDRVLPEEVAVALSFNGTTQAVMMATPADLEDFGYGFALTEGIARPEDILSVEVEELARGCDVQVWLRPEAEARLAARRRVMAGPVGCGLCGIDSIDQALREVPVVAPSAFRMTPSQVLAAVAALPGEQRLHDATRAVHGAAFWNGRVLLAREDVGRHNALDKLVGWALLDGRLPLSEAILLVSGRTSFEILQKALAAGIRIVCAISAPSSLAVDLAREYGITLVGFLRDDRCNVYSGQERVCLPSMHPAPASPA